MTEIVAELPLNIDSTMISCFRSCPRKFYHEFVLGLRPAAVSIDLHAGACFATAIETIRKMVHQDGVPLEVAGPRAYGMFLNEWGDFQARKETPKTPDRVWEAVEDYFRTYGPKTDHLQPQPGAASSFEFTFGIPLEPHGPEWDDQSAPGFPTHPSGNPFIYSGRFDMLGVLYGAKLAICDEKTTTSIGASWSENWDLRSQFLGYCWACQQSGLDVDTVVVRGVGILKTKISQAEAIKQYPRFLVARWYEQVRRDLWRIRRSWDEGYWDFNLADACTQYGGCSFKDLCTSEHPENWYNNFVVRRWNPLHKNPIEEKTNVPA